MRLCDGKHNKHGLASACGLAHSNNTPSSAEVCQKIEIWRTTAALDSHRTKPRSQQHCTFVLCLSLRASVWPKNSFSFATWNLTDNELVVSHSVNTFRRRLWPETRADIRVRLSRRQLEVNWDSGSDKDSSRLSRIQDSKRGQSAENVGEVTRGKWFDSHKTDSNALDRARTSVLIHQC